MTQDQEKIMELTAEVNRLRSSERAKHVRALEADAAELQRLRAGEREMQARIRELEAHLSTIDNAIGIEADEPHDYAPRIERMRKRIAELEKCLANANENTADMRAQRDKATQCVERLEAQLAAKPDVASDRTYGRNGYALPFVLINSAVDVRGRDTWADKTVHDLATHLREALAENAELRAQAAAQQLPTETAERKPGIGDRVRVRMNSGSVDGELALISGTACFVVVSESFAVWLPRDDILEIHPSTTSGESGVE